MRCSFLEPLCAALAELPGKPEGHGREEGIASAWESITRTLCSARWAPATTGCDRSSEHA